VIAQKRGKFFECRLGVANERRRTMLAGIIAMQVDGNELPLLIPE
jgi:hypothetical protein